MKRMTGMKVLIVTCIVAVVSPLSANANIPLTFQAGMETGCSLDDGCCMWMERIYDTNYAYVVITHVKHMGDVFNPSAWADSRVECTSTDSGAKIRATSYWEPDPPVEGNEYGTPSGWDASFRIVSGGLQIGTTESCPAGTPVMLNANVAGGSIFGNDSIDFYRGDELLYNWESMQDPMSLEVVAGEFISMTMDASFFASSPGFHSIGDTILFTSPDVAIPEPTTALLLLTGIPLLRRR